MTVLLNALKAKAAAQVTQWPQYRGHFDAYRLVRVMRRVKTKLGVAFEAGEIALCSPKHNTLPAPNGRQYLTVWSLRNAIDTSVPAAWIEEVQ